MKSIWLAVTMRHFALSVHPGYSGFVPCSTLGAFHLKKHIRNGHKVPFSQALLRQSCDKCCWSCLQPTGEDELGLPGQDCRLWVWCDLMLVADKKPHLDVSKSLLGRTTFLLWTCAELLRQRQPANVYVIMLLTSMSKLHLIAALGDFVNIRTCLTKSYSCEGDSKWPCYSVTCVFYLYQLLWCNSESLFKPAHILCPFILQCSHSLCLLPPKHLMQSHFDKKGNVLRSSYYHTSEYCISIQF